MARKDKLKELADALGVTTEWYIDWVVAPKVNSKGQKGAAEALGVSQASISGWLKGKYVMRPMWVKAITARERADIDNVVAQVKQERKHELA